MKNMLNQKESDDFIFDDLIEYHRKRDLCILALPMQGNMSNVDLRLFLDVPAKIFYECKKLLKAQYA